MYAARGCKGHLDPSVHTEGACVFDCCFLLLPLPRLMLLPLLALLLVAVCCRQPQDLHPVWACLPHAGAGLKQATRPHPLTNMRQQCSHAYFSCRAAASMQHARVLACNAQARTMESQGCGSAGRDNHWLCPWYEMVSHMAGVQPVKLAASRAARLGRYSSLPLICVTQRHCLSSACMMLRLHHASNLPLCLCFWGVCVCAVRRSAYTRGWSARAPAHCVRDPWTCRTTYCCDRPPAR